MLSVGGQSSLQSQLFDLRYNSIHICLAEELLSFGFDIANVSARIGDIIGHICFKRRVTNEYHQ